TGGERLEFLNGAATPVSLMTIASSGNIGIGTTTPTSLLTIDHVNSPLITVKNNATTIGLIGDADEIVSGGGTTDFGIRAANNFVIGTGGTTERMRITSTGNVGIGTSNPTVTLQVAGRITASSSAAVVQSLTSTVGAIALNSSTYIKPAL